MDNGFPATLINEWIAIEIIDQGMRMNRGLLLLDDNMKEDGIRPRVAKITAMSDKAKEDTKLEIGEFILVEHLGWTRSVELDYIDGVTKKTWFTVPKKILAKVNGIDGRTDIPVINSEIQK